MVHHDQVIDWQLDYENDQCFFLNDCHVLLDRLSHLCLKMFCTHELDLVQQSQYEREYGVTHCNELPLSKWHYWQVPLCLAVLSLLRGQRSLFLVHSILFLLDYRVLVQSTNWCQNLLRLAT